MTIVLIFSSNVFSQEIFTPYKIVSNSYKTVQGSEKFIEHMPRIRSQDTLGLCCSFSNATLLQKYYCDDVGIQNCSDVSMDETISPVAITGFREPVKSQKDPQTGKYDKQDKKTFAHTFLSSDGTEEGCNATVLLDHASIQHTYCPESFFPFDQFVGMNNFSNLDRKSAQDEMGKLANGKISELQKTFNKYKTEAKAVESCTECLAEIKKIIPINGRDDFLQRAFKKNSFQEFLHEALFKSCDKKVKLTTPTMDYFPKTDLTGKENEFTSNKNHPLKIQIMNQIKKVVNENVPLQMSFCINRKDRDCTGVHVAVISGYKKVCNENNQCADMIKIQNSYGKTWQEMHNDGWVLADDMLNATWGSSKKNMIGPGLLSWVSKGPLN